MKIAGTERKKLSGKQKLWIKIVSISIVSVLAIWGLYLYIPDLNFPKPTPTEEAVDRVYNDVSIVPGNEKALQEKTVSSYETIEANTGIQVKGLNLTSTDESVVKANADKVLATYSDKVKTKMTGISSAIKVSTGPSADKYDSMLLQKILLYASTGNNKYAPTDFIDVTPQSWVTSVQTWLFSSPEDKFTWKLRGDNSTGYKNILKQALYKKSFSNITNGVVVPVVGTSPDFINAKYIFVSNGKKYTASLSNRNGSLFLIDIKSE